MPSRIVKKALETPWMSLFFVLLGVKIFFMVSFQSNPQETYFIPFITHFLKSFDNPWDYFYANDPGMRFPYPPLLLYIHALFLAPYVALGEPGMLLQNFFFKLPLLAADCLIFFVLNRMFPNRLKEVVLFYFASPIIIYVCFIHFQFDLLAVAFLCLALYFLSLRRLNLSALVFGLSMSTKFPTVAALPLLAIYILKNHKLKDVAVYIFWAAAVYLFFVAPYVQSQGYQALALKNPEQGQIFSLFIPIGELKIFLAPLAVFIIYARFFAYRKTNQDLLTSFLGLLFASFIVFIPPMPNWYVWMMPFLSMFLISAGARQRGLAIFYWLVSAVYLGYFVFFYEGNMFYPSIDYVYKIFGHPIDPRLKIPLVNDLVFTVLQGLICVLIYSLHKYGVKSNSIYRKKSHSLMLGIAGDSSSGKTTLLSDLKSLLGASYVLGIEGDGNHKWERNDENWKNITHLNPKANYLYKQGEDLWALKNGHPIEITEYDHTTGTFTRPQRVGPKDYVIICGLHSFYLPKTRKAMDIKIYLDTDESLRQHWKMLRDKTERGYSLEAVLEKIKARLPDAVKYVHPQKDFADMVVSYSPAEETNDPKTRDKIKVRVTLDSNVHLDRALSFLADKGISFFHDYEMDLKAQYIIVEEEFSQAALKELTKECISNVKEIAAKEEIDFQPGLRGFVQFLVLLVISEQLKEDVSYDR